MTDAVKELLERARSLGATERASLVGELLATLDEPDTQVEAAWRLEVERRLDLPEPDRQAAVPWAGARGRLGL